MVKEGEVMQNEVYPIVSLNLTKANNCEETTIEEKPQETMLETFKAINVQNVIDTEFTDDSIDVRKHTIELPHGKIECMNDLMCENEDVEDVFWEKGISITEFLRKNTKIRTKEQLLQYYDSDIIEKAIRVGAIVCMHGRLLI
jgi:hypothetical protein